MKKTTDYADDTDKEKTMRDFWLGLGRAGHISVQVCRFREDFPGCKLQVESCKWVAAGPANLQLSTCNLQLVSHKITTHEANWSE